MTTKTTEPTRERVEAYEKALGCEPTEPIGHGIVVCLEHGGRVGLWRPDGCPVAVAAARVEAEETARLDAILRQVRYMARCNAPGYEIAMFLADIRDGRIEVQPEWASR